MSRPKLSKGILEMKFMQRTKIKVEKETEDAEGRAMYSNEITDKMMRGSSNFIIEPSFFQCEDSIEGRLSYRGMNPEIERIMELEQQTKQATGVPDKMEKEVSDNEMADYYKSVGAIKSDHKKRKIDGRPGKNKKGKFLKPQED